MMSKLISKQLFWSPLFFIFSIFECWQIWFYEYLGKSSFPRPGIFAGILISVIVGYGLNVLMVFRVNNLFGKNSISRSRVFQILTVANLKVAAVFVVIVYAICYSMSFVVAPADKKFVLRILTEDSSSMEAMRFILICLMVLFGMASMYVSMVSIHRNSTKRVLSNLLVVDSIHLKKCLFAIFFFGLLVALPMALAKNPSSVCKVLSVMFQFMSVALGGTVFPFILLRSFKGPYDGVNGGVLGSSASERADFLER